MRLSIEVRGWRLELSNESQEVVQVSDAGSYPIEVDASEEPIDRECWVALPSDRIGFE